MNKPINPFEPDMLDGYYETRIRPHTPPKQEEKKEGKKSSDLPFYIILAVILLVLMALGSAF